MQKAPAPARITPTVRTIPTDAAASREAAPMLDAAAEVLAAAFRPDPLWAWLLPDADERARQLPRFFRFFTRMGAAGSTAFGAYAGGAPSPALLRAVAVWERPTAPRPPFSLKTTLNTAWAAARLFSPAFLKTIPRAAAYFVQADGAHKRAITTTHFYLEVLGTAPEAQGQGMASALLRPVLAEADLAGLPAFTETATPENVPLYEHFGFRVVEEYRDPAAARAGIDLRLWSMLRPAGG